MNTDRKAHCNASTRRKAQHMVSFSRNSLRRLLVVKVGPRA